MSSYVSSQPDYQQWVLNDENPTTPTSVRDVPSRTSTSTDQTDLRNYWPWPTRALEHNVALSTISDPQALRSQLAHIWQSVLGRGDSSSAAHEDLPTNMTFLQLGGDSLRAQEILVWVHDQFGINLTARDLLGTATLETLADKIVSHLPATHPLAIAMAHDETEAGEDPERPQQLYLPEQFTVPGTNGTSASTPSTGEMTVASIPTGPIECTPSQRRFWVLDQLHPGNAAYNVVSAFTVNGPLNITALSATLQIIVNRHEALRTHFIAPDGMPRQVIDSQFSLPPISVIDLTAVPAETQAQAITRHTEEAAQAPFDLQHPPLFRFLVLQIAPDQFILEIVLHHILCDGWAIAILLHDLEFLYPEAARGMTAPALDHYLPAPRLQYSQYSQQVAASLAPTHRAAQDHLEASRTYWYTQLQDAPTSLDLPQDQHSRSDLPALAGKHRLFHLTAEQSSLIFTWSQQEGVTLASACLAAWATLLSRYCSQDDLVLGLPIAGRDTSEWLEVFGLCINTVVVRLHTDPNISFRDLVHQVQERIFEADEHSQVPFDEVVRWIGSEKHLQHHTSSLFNVLFAMQSVPTVSSSRMGLTFTPLEVETGSSIEDLTLECWRDGDLLTGRIEYRTDLFSTTFIEHMLQHFVLLLLGGISNADSSALQLPLLSPQERDTILKHWNQTQLPILTDRLVQDNIVDQAVQRPHAPAVVASGPQGPVEISYGDLFARAAALASQLRALQVSIDVPVALLLDRSIAWVVAEVATLLAGGYFIAIDPRQPPERLRAILTEARPPVVLTTQRLFTALGPDILPEPDQGSTCRPGPTLLYLDPITADVVATSNTLTDDQVRAPSTPLSTLPPFGSAGRSIFNLEPDGNAPPLLPQGRVRPTAKDLAYSVFTSGSTGIPKGVCITHGSLVNFVSWYREAFELSAADRFTCMAGLGFDVAISEIWPTLASGGTLYLVDEMTSYDTDRLQAFMLQSGITVAYVPTPLCERLLTRDWPSDASLRIIVTGGDRLHSFTPAGLPFTLYNVYGPSETTVWSTWCPVPTVAEAAADSQISPTIGWPIANTQLFVLDRNLQPVPVGVPGELYIGGAGLARGYLNRPEVTQQRFIANPFYRAGAVSGYFASSPRLYRTGDLVRWLPTGELDFIGRVDTQVKIAGFRIELGEIEAALRSYPAVRAALVMPIDRKDLEALQPPTSDTQQDIEEQRLVAFVEAVGEEPHQTIEANLTALLARRVPFYMIPSRIVVLEHLPENQNGKHDRAAALRILKGTSSGRPSTRTSIPLQPRSTATPLMNGTSNGTGHAFTPVVPTNGGHDTYTSVTLPPPAPERRQSIPMTQVPLPGPKTRELAFNLPPAVQEMIQSLWLEALNQDDRPVPADEDFFLEGGSLDATKLLAQISKALSISIPLTAFFASPTFGTLCRLLCQQPDLEAMERQAQYLLARV